MFKHNHHMHGNIPVVGNAHTMRENPTLMGFTKNNAIENRLRQDPRLTGFTQINTMDNQPNTHLRDNIGVENEFMNGVFQQEVEEDSETDPEIPVKETRGPTYMQSVWGHAPNLPHIHVEYNEFGQPIGGENSKLCHFLGSISRNGKYCPIDVKNWHAMLSTKKTEMLDVVKLRFHVPVVAKKWILTSIGHKWRNCKHSLKTKYWVDVPVEHLIEHRDERVVLDQWVKLLTYWRSEEAKKASHRNKNARDNKLMNQRTGKTSFAQIRARLTKEQGCCPTRVQLFKSCFVPSNGNSSSVAFSKYSEMQERSNQLPEGSNDEIGPNDVFAQIMGDDAPGHVRMLGHGICPSDVWNEAQRSTSNRLLVEHREKIAHLENMLLMQQRSCPSQVDSGHYPSSFDSRLLHPTPTLHLQDGMNVLLKNLFNPTKTVAKGRVHNTNPSTVVGGQMLGLNWCEVNVQVIVEPDERLIRPYNNLQMLSQTKGAMIAWPCNLVAAIEER
ncbi:hypothetical protein C2S52_021358 [Perilla frutescens var. hirtella]|nr:hypothetical protein C2S52_021358 [Perilla frutescens var. hirtella]